MLYFDTDSILAQAAYIVEYNATVRKTAEVFKISKSGVYRNMTQKLPNIDFELYLKVSEVLRKNKVERCSRGGIAMRGVRRNRRKQEN